MTANNGFQQTAASRLQLKPNTLDRTEGGAIVSSPDYPWDIALDDLIALLANPWATPLGKIGRRQEAASFFAMRVGSRIGSLNRLFGVGLYNDAFAIVRSAYEDWLTAAYVLQLEGEERWLRFLAEVDRIDARVYEAFVRLCGQDLANARFSEIPPGVRRHMGQSKRAASKDAWPGFAAVADKVGLRAVHDYVYTRLSTYSHPTGRSFGRVFDREPGKVTARIPKRDSAAEYEPALWAWWFELRTITLAQREFGIDSEAHSDDLIALRDERELVTCVLVRESSRSA